jgi:hypothetical protein
MAILAWAAKEPGREPVPMEYTILLAGLENEMSKKEDL